MTGEHSKPRVRVEVAYAKPHEQKILTIQVEEGTSLLEAVRQSGIQSFFPEIDVESSKLGLYGKAVPKPADQAVREGDRIEIYRALIADPKEVRKRRAAQAKQKKEASA
ncbi:protein RnfH [Endozoicomonas montiporae]|uniref:UPF0125 protein GZ77_21060 n=2 Tax=Endozoicomonas montiporae TaxID=1027273 RepID=A0A081N3A4_9GAMM|nr:RnfH family protein [Endozoicomonas montiporae]AMO58220.1 hypothetical protein EZMO1_4302 [Endozoicomonas montiporae CL-33]KEQ12927.1 protein RnfH [Endozoicomonas montiporae]